MAAAQKNIKHTDEQEDLTTAGQRRVNLIWETTQAIIAIMVVGSGVYAGIYAMTHDKEMSAFLAFLTGNVTGFYFARTNHAAIGGEGKKPNQKYEGR